MQGRIRASLTVALIALGGICSAQSRDKIAQYWAPVIYQETYDPVKDLFTAFDFDGNWNGDDNSENMQCWNDASRCNTSDNPNSACAGQKCPLIATVYYTVIETDTHWFVQYMPYHPLDWKLTNGHENDTESMLAVVEKTGVPYGRLLVLETRFHLDWFDYAIDSTITGNQGSVDGPIHFDSLTNRPAVYSQMVGHGICGGFSPPNYIDPELSLLCQHDQPPHIDKTGVIYAPDLAATMPTVVSNTTVRAGYAMVELYTSVWTHIHEIGSGKAFQSAIDYGGERCAMFQCPKQFGGNWEGNEGQSPGEPWAQVGGAGTNADGDQFFDPAYTMSQRLHFPTAMSLTYCYNPYLGIADTCGAGDGGVDAAAEDGALAIADGAPADGAHVRLGSDGGTRGASAANGCGCSLGQASVPRPGAALALALLWCVCCAARRRRGS